MRTTVRDKKRWVLLINRSKIKNRLWNAELAGCNVNRWSLNKLPTRRKTQMSLRCRRISLLKSFGQPSSKPKWKRKWNKISSMKMLSKRFVLPLVTLMFKKLSKNFWPVNLPTLSSSALSLSKRRRSMLSETITSSGERNYTNCKFLKVKPTPKPIGQAARSPPNSTPSTRKLLSQGSKLIVPNMYLVRCSLLTIKCRAGVREWFKSWISNSMRILARIRTSQWHSNLKK